MRDGGGPNALIHVRTNLFPSLQIQSIDLSLFYVVGFLSLSSLQMLHSKVCFLLFNQYPFVYYLLHPLCSDDFCACATSPILRLDWYFIANC